MSPTQNPSPLQLQRMQLLSVLGHAHEFRWSVHGIGMLRTYPVAGNKTWRINLWHSSLRIPGISSLHTHPWDFASYILAGRIGNVRYLENRNAQAKTHLRRQIECGDAGCVIGEDEYTSLTAINPVEVYRAGGQYIQHASEIHATSFDDGSITLNKRAPYTGNGVPAVIYWPLDEPFVNSDQHVADDNTVAHVVAQCLKVLRNDS